MTPISPPGPAAQPPEKPPEVTFETKISVEGTNIIRDVTVFVEGARQSAWRRSFDTAEPEVRAALIELGWTPP